MEKKVDLRVQKTRSALTAALYDLLCEKSLDDITVTELCKRAVIRKATFYKHFGDKNELLTYMIQQLQDIALEENMLGYDENIPQSYYIGVFRYFIDFLESNEKFVVSILQSSASSGVQDILSKQIQLDIKSHLKKDEYPDVSAPSAMLAAIYAGAIVSCGKWWILSKNRPDKESIVKAFSEFVMKLWSNENSE